MLVPSGAIAGASAASLDLARIVGAFGLAVPMPATVAAGLATSIQRVIRVSAVRLFTRDDVAALGRELVTLLQVAARAAEPADAALALYAAAAQASAAFPRSASPSLTRDYALARSLAASIETACLGEAFLAEARTTFGNRQSATAARERIGAALDAARDRIAGALGEVVSVILASAAREASGHLVRLGADLQPVIRVATTTSVPSSALAWSLYADPARAEDLVARNRVGTPLFMPTSIEALSPQDRL